MIVVDYFDLAKRILYNLEVFYPHLRITEEGEDVKFIAHYLEATLDPELLNELQDTELGLGIIVGTLSTLYGEGYGIEDGQAEEIPPKDRQC